MNNEDFADQSDSSDEDYVPDGKQEENLSEVESDGDSEEPASDTEETFTNLKRRKNSVKIKKKRKKNEVVEEEKTATVKESDNKTNVDDLWADFIKDTGFKPKSSKNEPSQAMSTGASRANEVKPVENKPPENKPAEKVKITQIFEFAGEEVKVEKEVDANSTEAILAKNKESDSLPSKSRKSGGLSNILSQLGKKQKISTLEKSKLDWDKFKKEEKIEEELETFNKGKDGYLDRQDFLQRADLRRFEIEKEIRTVERNKRFNSTL